MAYPTPDPEPQECPVSVKKPLSAKAQRTVASSHFKAMNEGPESGASFWLWNVHNQSGPFILRGTGQMHNKLAF